MTSVITSGSTGFGVGVGFGFQSGGGGGKSLTVFCASAVGADRKMASTPIRSAGHTSFFSTPRIIFDTIRACFMLPICRPAWFLSYRFCDGVIHRLLRCRATCAELHEK